MGPLPTGQRVCFFVPLAAVLVEAVKEVHAAGQRVDSLLILPPTKGLALRWWRRGALLDWEFSSLLLSTLPIASSLAHRWWWRGTLLDGGSVSLSADFKPHSELLAEGHTLQG